MRVKWALAADELLVQELRNLFKDIRIADQELLVDFLDDPIQQQLLTFKKDRLLLLLEVRLDQGFPDFLQEELVPFR